MLAQKWWCVSDRHHRVLQFAVPMESRYSENVDVNLYTVEISAIMPPWKVIPGTHIEALYTPTAFKSDSVYSNS